VTGLPIGIQLVARFGREDMLLAVARQLEQGLDGEGIWNQGLPEMYASTMELA
jgi:amidase